MSASCIYHGFVRHRRNLPVHHQFDFSAFMLFLDLDELPTIFRDNWLWSSQRPAVARFKESEHLIDFADAGDLKARVHAAHLANSLAEPQGPIRLLTQFRYFGFAMNPVSFYYCFDPSGMSVQSILAEVNNTPWGEQHVYAIERQPPPGEGDPRARSNDRSEGRGDSGQSESRQNASNKRLSQARIRKTFHVSPFMSLEMFYRMAFSHPGEKLAVKIENHTWEDVAPSRAKLLDVTMSLKRQPLNPANLNRLLWRYPAYSFKTFAAIYWQAFRLYRKKVPFYSHPGKASLPPSNETPAETLTLASDPPIESSAQADSKSGLVSR